MSMGLANNKESSTSFLVILFLLLCCMSWFDITSSNQAGLRNADRSIAHVFIALVVILHGRYVWINRCKNTYGETINFILICVSVWFLLIDIFRGAPISSSGAMILLSIWWILTYNFSYSYCKKQKGNILPLLWMYLGMFIVWVCLNLYARSQIILNFGRENAVTGYAYYLLIFVPYILLLKDSWIKKGLLLVSIIMILTSFKRGTMVTLPAMLLVYGYVKGVIERNMSKYIGFACLLTIAALFILPIIDENSGGFLSERFSSEQLASGSGRTWQRDVAMENVNERNFVDFLIGTGHGSSVQLLGTGVHNEWVEFLFSFGLIGALFYFALGIYFLYQCYYFYKRRSRYAPHICMMMVYYYMVSIFSGFIGVYVTYYFFAFMGMVTYLNEREIELITQDS